MKERAVGMILPFQPLLCGSVFGFSRRKINTAVFQSNPEIDVPVEPADVTPVPACQSDHMPAQ